MEGKQRITNASSEIQEAVDQRGGRCNYLREKAVESSRTRVANEAFVPFRKPMESINKRDVTGPEFSCVFVRGKDST